MGNVMCPPTPQLVARIINMHLDHVPSSHIARRLGVRRYVVNRVIKEHLRHGRG